MQFDNLWQEKAAREFLRSWSERRGIESIDRNARILLVKTSLDAISDILAETAIETKRDVIGSEITILGSFAFAYQIDGQNWSIVTLDEMPNTEWLSRNGLATLSKRLQQPVINLSMSDSCGYISYELFEDGAFIEYFVGDEGENYRDSPADEELQIQKFELPIPEEPDCYRHAYFWSCRRQITAQQIISAWSFAEEFLLEYDAFDPAIDTGHFLEGYYAKFGKQYKIQHPEMTLVLDATLRVKSVPPFVRVDYFRFDSGSEHSSIR
jgi:hypothetical protein